MITRRSMLASSLSLGSCAVCAGLIASRALAQGHKQTGHGQSASLTVEGANYKLAHVGSMREAIMNGRREAQLDLRTLAGRKGLQGIGPLEGLAGEATIVDGRPSLSRVAVDGTIQIKESFEAAVPFFVWADVGAWRSQPLPDDVGSFSDLERVIDAAAADAGLRQAFPFKIAGRMDVVKFHIIDGKPTDGVGMADHLKTQKHFERQAENGTLIGFWSRDHKGLFVPMNSNVHVHYQAADNSSSGHIEDVRLGKDLQLMLPKP
jgi:acetolactate decarboxylase